MSQIPSPSMSTNLRGAVDLSSLVNRSAAPAPGEGAAGAEQGEPLALPSLFFEGTDANFNDFIDLSMRIPVVLNLSAEWAEPSTQLSPVLERAVAGLSGRAVLVKVDVEANPQLAQAFQAQSVPAVAALVAGRPVQLFVGALPESQISDVLAQLLELAAQNGITGTVAVEGDAGVPDAAETGEPAPKPLPPHHAEALEAIERGDYATAIQEYKTAIAQDPRDAMAVAGLAQVNLLSRLSGTTLEAVRSAAAADPKNVQAQLDVADVDLSGGHVEDAFDRLLVLFPALDTPGKEKVRTRLLDYFEIVGAEDQRVARARARLTSLLY